jgi:hypothetical protein
MRYKTAYISVNNNNTNLNFLKILSFFTMWDGLSLKIISRYCAFKMRAEPGKKVGWSWKGAPIQGQEDETGWPQ